MNGRDEVSAGASYRSPGLAPSDDAVVAGLRARGTELVGELERYKDS